MARRSPAIDDEMLFRGLREGQVQAETVVTDQVQFNRTPTFLVGRDKGLLRRRRVTSISTSTMQCYASEIGSIEEE